jgi:hypothetical protein
MAIYLPTHTAQAHTAGRQGQPREGQQFLFVSFFIFLNTCNMQHSLSPRAKRTSYRFTTTARVSWPWHCIGERERKSNQPTQHACQACGTETTNQHEKTRKKFNTHNTQKNALEMLIWRGFLTETALQCLAARGQRPMAHTRPGHQRRVRQQ